MFTGLIEAVCSVKSVSRQAGTGPVRLWVDLGKSAEGVKIGDSIAVNGVCLTVAGLDGNTAEFDVSGETLAKSALGRLKPLSAVNIERALRPTDRLGGHFVQGHIDGTATIKSIDRHGPFADIDFALEPELLEQMVVKGSVAVDGISLTIASINRNDFRSAIIPETLAKTTLGRAKIGETVNVEIDIIAKTVKRQFESTLGELPQKQTLTIEKLKELGF